jgi:hypothetical protein
MMVLVTGLLLTSGPFYAVFELKAQEHTALKITFANSVCSEISGYYITKNTANKSLKHQFWI